jgi:Mrp family chromosome partitioning ATPase/capsular polysaccharide biosynthesis protein
MERSDPTSPRLPGLRDHLRVLRRRWWILLIPILLVPAAAAYVSHRQTELYEASANVLVNFADVSAATAPLSGEPAFSKEDANRFLATQATLARAPVIAAKTLKAVGLEEREPQDLLANSRATVSGATSVMTLAVTDHNPQLAKRLVREYSRQYIDYRRRIDTGALSRTIAKINDRLKRFRTAAERRSTVYAGLVRQRDVLRTQLGLRTESAYLVSASSQATLVQPDTPENIAIGLGIGIVLGLALAFLVDALDNRVRTPEEIAETLGIPVLAAVPPPPRKIGDEELLMLEEPQAAEAEAFRMLRANLAFADTEGEARVMMVCSAHAGEGKTTTAANLAVTLARMGKSVVVVDLDLRRPSVGRVFDLKGRVGVTNVALGQVDIEAALHPIPMGASSTPSAPTANGHRAPASGLWVMPSGPLPPSPGEFVGSAAVGRVIKALRQRADVILVDTPPLLSVGDAMAAGAHVDAIVVVARLRMLRKRALKVLAVRLERISARKLGAVVTGMKSSDAGYYGYYGYYGQADEPGGPSADGSEPASREPTRAGGN